MPFVPSSLIYAKRTRGKGLGVFARVDLEADQEIERVPVVVLPIEEVRRAVGGGVVGNYAFSWGRGELAIALGYGSLYNHAVHPNALCEDRAPRTKVFIALRPIPAGQEITINYHGQPGDPTPLDFTLR